jgi:hypothetical protein
MKIQFFTTLGCHLCEEALTQLHYLQGNGLNLDIELIEIADSDELIERYGVRIPVVLKQTAEIGWPFTVQELEAFLEDRNY